MKLITRLTLGAALLGASASALAQLVVPTPPYNNTIPLPSNLSTGGGLMFTMYSTDNAGAPFSYEFNLGLTYSQILTSSTTGMNTPGLTLTWNLTGVSLGNVPTTDLVWDVSAAKKSTGSILTAGVYGVDTTLAPGIALSTIQTMGGSSTPSTVVQNTYSQNLAYLNDINTVASNPKTTTSGSDVNNAFNTYNITLNTLPFNAGAPVSSTLNWYQLTNGAGSTSNVNATQFAGTWSLNLTNDTLTYSVPGGSSVPLPAALWLLLSGLGGTALIARRRPGVQGPAAA